MNCSSVFWSLKHTKFVAEYAWIRWGTVVIVLKPTTLTAQEYRIQLLAGFQCIWSTNYSPTRPETSNVMYLGVPKVGWDLWPADIYFYRVRLLEYRA